MSVRLMEGVIAAAMPTWHPAQFIQRPEDGSWFNANLSQLKQLYTGVTDVSADEDPVGYWLDHLGSRSFKQTNSGFRPRWDATNQAVEFHMINNSDPRSMTFSIPDGSLESDGDVTIMAVMQSDLVFGKVRALVGLSKFTASQNYVSLCSRWPGSIAGASVYPYTAGTGPNDLTGGSVDDTFSVLSVTRSKVAGAKLINLYLNGVLVAAGPSTNAGSTSSDSVIGYIFGPGWDNDNQTACFRVKDVIIAFKKANVTDHIGYFQYASSLP